MCFLDLLNPAYNGRGDNTGSNHIVNSSRWGGLGPGPPNTDSAKTAGHLDMAGKIFICPTGNKLLPDTVSDEKIYCFDYK